MTFEISLHGSIVFFLFFFVFFFFFWGGGVGGGSGLFSKIIKKKNNGQLLLCRCTPHYRRWDRGPVTTQVEKHLCFSPQSFRVRSLMTAQSFKVAIAAFGRNPEENVSRNVAHMNDFTSSGINIRISSVKRVW